MTCVTYTIEYWEYDYATNTSTMYDERQHTVCHYNAE